MVKLAFGFGSMVPTIETVRRIGVVAVENDTFRVVVTTILESELGFAQVIAVNSLEETLDWLSDAEGVSLALFDLNAPGMPDASSLSILRECCPDIRLVVSGPMRRAEVLLALHGGVHGYISDAMSVAAITKALSMVVAGDIFVPPIVAELTPQSLSQVAAMARDHRREEFESPSPRAAPSDFNLTPRQRDVLRLVIHGRSNKEIARALNLRESTVKVHLAAIFRLLGVHNRSGAAGIGVHFIDSKDDLATGWGRLAHQPDTSASTAE